MSHLKGRLAARGSRLAAAGEWRLAAGGFRLAAAGDWRPAKAFAGACVLVFLAAACYRPSGSGNVSPRPVPAPAAAPAGGKPAAPENPAAARELGEIRTAFTAIPRTFNDLSSEEIKRITAAAQACRQRAEAYLSDFAGSPGEPEAAFVLARLLLILKQVERAALFDGMSKRGLSPEEMARESAPWQERYFARMAELARRAVAGMEKGHPGRAEALDLLGEVLAQAKKQREAIEVYQTLLAEFPDHSTVPDALLVMATCHQELEEYSQAVARVREALTRFPRHPSFPTYHEWLRRIHHSAGDLPALLKAVEELRQSLPRRLREEGVSKNERDLADRLLAYSGFNLGLARFALGDHGGALQAFQEHIAELDAMERERGTLPADYGVYRDFRSRDYVKVLETSVGRPAPDLGGVLWSGSPPPLPPGMPLAILFRAWGEERSAPFLQALDRHHRKRREAFNLCQVSYQRGSGDPQDALAEASAEMAKLGVECPVGIDPDSSSHTLFEAFHASVGSATFIVLDRWGVYAWFQQDPTQRDEKFALAILERLIR